MSNSLSVLKLAGQVFGPTPRSVPVLVDELLSLCPEDGLELDWRADHCCVRLVGVEPEESVRVPRPKSVFARSWRGWRLFATVQSRFCHALRGGRRADGRCRSRHGSSGGVQQYLGRTTGAVDSNPAQRSRRASETPAGTWFGLGSCASGHPRRDDPAGYRIARETRLCQHSATSRDPACFS